MTSPLPCSGSARCQRKRQVMLILDEFQEVVEIDAAAVGWQCSGMGWI